MDGASCGYGARPDDQSPLLKRLALEGIIVISIPSTNLQHRRCEHIRRDEQWSPALALAHVNPLVSARTRVTRLIPRDDDIAQGHRAGPAGHRHQLAQQEG